MQATLMPCRRSGRIGSLERMAAPASSASCRASAPMISILSGDRRRACGHLRRGPAPERGGSRDGTRASGEVAERRQGAADLLARGDDAPAGQSPPPYGGGPPGCCAPDLLSQHQLLRRLPLLLLRPALRLR